MCGNCRASPLSADIRINPFMGVWGEHDRAVITPRKRPRGFGASAKGTGCPPASETFLSLPPAKKPTQFPSGEKNG